MNRFRPPSGKRNTSSGWTRRGAIAAAAGLAVGCGSTAEAQKPSELALWPTEGPPVLRGAVIAQRRRRVEVDGETFGGGQAVLPAYGAKEFDALAEAGANLVVMSYPELWTVTAPYKRSAPMADILGRQLDAAKAAGLYVVLALRSGPGRSDFVFHRDSAGDWFDVKLIVDSIWTNAEQQAAWQAMCVDAAKLIKDRSETAGLNIMVEPDPNVSGTNRQGQRLGAWEPEEYTPQVSRVSDWKRLSGEIAKAVRRTAPDLPILISPPAFARTDFLPVMGQPPVPGTVWCIHDYEPRDYTHTTGRERGLHFFSDDDPLFANQLDAAKKQGAPVFLGEFGASSAAMERSAYHAARIATCEAKGVAWSVFRWPTFDAAYEKSDDMFDVTNRNTRGDDKAAPTIDVLRQAWAKNTARPAASSGLRGRN